MHTWPWNYICQRIQFGMENRVLCIPTLFYNWQNYTHKKISIVTSTGILIASSWSTQLCYSHLMKILIETPILLPFRKNLLVLLTLVVQPNWKMLDLLVCLVSGKNIWTQKFRSNQLAYLQKAGVRKSLNNINHTSIISFAWI